MSISLTLDEFTLLACAFLSPSLIGLLLCLSLIRVKHDKKKKLLMTTRIFSGVLLFIGNYIFLFNQTTIIRALSLSMILTALMMIGFMYPFNSISQSDSEENKED